MRRLVVITGLSGSGKSLAADCLEDQGYFCVDNLPVDLIPPFYELISKSAGKLERAALVIDIRGENFLDQFPEILSNLRASQAPVELLFLDCSDDTLKRRFKETRRPHPVSGSGITLDEAISEERTKLQAIRELADRVIDTTRFSVHQLRTFMSNAFGVTRGKDALNIGILSFGFKYGLPAEADLVFDVRFLPNPHFVEDLRPLPGTDPAVRSFVESHQETAEFCGRLFDMMDYLVPRYLAEGKSYLTVAIGCTGGKHRSVALSEALSEHLSSTMSTVSVIHRDVGRE